MTGPDSDDLMQIRVGERRLAIALSVISDVFDTGFVTPVPLTPRHVVGLASHRGKTLCVLSLAALLGIVDGTASDEAMTLGLRWNDQPLALRVDAAEDVFQRAELTPFEGGFRHPAIGGLYRRGDMPVSEINISTLLATLPQIDSGAPA